MKRAWELVGIVCYWLTWPGVALFLQNSTRTRVIVVSGDEILLLKTWLGAGKWGLPGGGLRKNEDPATGALRELTEETGITTSVKSLEYVTTHVQKKRGIKYELIVYALRLPKKPTVRKQRFEIHDFTWRSWQAIYGSDKAKPYIKKFLEQSFLSGLKDDI